jgi:hypothetical protein
MIKRDCLRVHLKLYLKVLKLHFIRYFQVHEEVIVSAPLFSGNVEQCFVSCYVQR